MVFNLLCYNGSDLYPLAGVIKNKQAIIKKRGIGFYKRRNNSHRQALEMDFV